MAYQRVEAGKGMMICISGEPGIGKTALAEDALAEFEALGRPCVVAHGRCSERVAGTEGYLPFLEALDALRRESQAAANTMRLVAPSWYSQVTPSSSRPSLDAVRFEASSLERLKQELGLFLSEISKSQPLVLFLDDLHWADASTVDLLAYVGTRLDTMRVLIVLTYRRTELLTSKHALVAVVRDLQARGVCREFVLHLLSEDDISSFLSLEYPGNNFPADFPALVFQKTEGSPLFLVDLLQYLRERSIIGEDDGLWLLKEALPAFEGDIPQSIHSMILRKIDQLNEDDLQILRVASVQGPEFDSAVVAHVMGRDVAEVEERLEILDKVHAFVRILREQECAEGVLNLRYKFVHGLYQNVIYDDLSPTRRARRSKDVADAIVTLYGDRAQECAAELAQLFLAARDMPQAITWFQAGAMEALQKFAHHEAARLASNALAILREQGPGSRRREFDLLLILGAAVQTTEGWAGQQLSDIYQRAHDLGADVANVHEQVAVLAGLWNFRIGRAQYDEAMPLAREIKALAATEVGLKPISSWPIAETAFWMGLAAESREAAQVVVDAYEEQRDRHLVLLFGQDAAVVCRAYLGVGEAARLQVSRAKTILSDGVALARRLGQSFDVTIAFIGFAMATCILGDPQECRAQADGAIEMATRDGFASLLALASILRGWALSAGGETAAGVTQISAALENYRSLGGRMGEAFFLGLLGESYLRQERYDLAKATIDRGIEIAESRGDGFYEAELHRIRADILGREGAKTSAILASLVKTATIAEARGTSLFELRAANRIARLLSDTEDAPRALDKVRALLAGREPGGQCPELTEAEALLGHRIATGS